MKRLRIGIDLDGVVADFCARYRQLTLDTFNKPDPPDMPQTNWDPPWVSKEEDDLIWKQIRGTQDFWLSLGPEKGTSLLTEASYLCDIYFITTRTPTLGQATETQSQRWLYTHFDIRYPQVIVTRKKGEVAAALDLFAFIDDKPSNLDRIQAEAPTCARTTYLRDKPYNQESQAHIRVPDLNTFLKRLP